MRKVELDEIKDTASLMDMNYIMSINAERCPKIYLYTAEHNYGIHHIEAVTQEEYINSKSALIAYNTSEVQDLVSSLL